MEHPDIRGLEQWQVLAPGPHAVVWRARQAALDRAVAVKVYAGTATPAARRDFLHATASAARLAGHPGVGSVHDAGLLPDGRPYVVGELATGGSVAAWLQGAERPAEERVRRVGAVVAGALAVAHDAGVVHGAVGPANVLIDGYDAPVLVDFGAALLHPAPGPTGSPNSSYGAPEAAEGLRPAPPADVYALAATLCALLTGCPPDLAGPARPRRPGRAAAPPLWDVDPALRSLLLGALAVDPAARPGAAALRDGLLRRPGPVGPTPSRSPVLAPAGRPPAGRPARPGVLAGVAVLAVLGSTGAWLASITASSGPATNAVTAAAAAGSSPGGGTPVAAPASRGATAAAVQLALEAPAEPAEPFQAVRIRGTHTGGARTTFLRVQRWERGAWRTFPVPTRADRTGRFTTHVELGQPGRYRLRVLDPGSGVASESVLLVVDGS